METHVIEGLHAKWRDMIAETQSAIADLLQQRSWMERLGQMFRDNKNFMYSNNFDYELVRWYTAFALMALRRQTDTGAKVISLRSMLEQMKANPPALADVSPEGHNLKLDEIAADIVKLDAVSKKIVRVADKEIAHAERGGYGNEDDRPRIKELNASVDEFAAVAKKYFRVLTGGVMLTRAPVETFDSNDIFCFPWIPACEHCGHSANWHQTKSGGTCNGRVQDFHLTKHLADPPRLKECSCELTESEVYAQTSRAT